jgi:hypothetical protein
MEEIWKDIAGYEGIYQVSNLGEVKSLSRTICSSRGSRIVKEKILKPGVDKDGYLFIRLCNNKNHKYFKVHFLVLNSFFVEKNESYNQIDHINNIKNDNRLVNLRWVTSSENCTLRNLKNNISKKYIGTSYHYPTKKWSARRTHNGNRIYLGLFNTQQEAFERVIKYDLENQIINRFI